jgi:hypothetical protein
LWFCRSNLVSLPINIARKAVPAIKAIMAIIKSAGNDIFVPVIDGVGVVIDDVVVGVGEGEGGVVGVGVGIGVGEGEGGVVGVGVGIGVGVEVGVDVGIGAGGVVLITSTSAPSNSIIGTLLQLDIAVTFEGSDIQ